MLPRTHVRAAAFAAGALLLALASLAAPVPAGAQGRVIFRDCRVPTPRPLPDDRRRPLPLPVPRPCGAQVERTRSEVRVELVDRVLRYEVEERFVNRGGAVGEADYLFPLPKGAAFQELKLSIDGEMVAGETLPAEEARRIYEEIVRRQRDPALVEWMGMGLLRTRIFPFNPGEERRIVVRYEVVAEREGDALRVEHTAGRGWSDAMQRGAPAVAQQSQSGRTTMTLSYPDRAEYGTPYSPTHALDVSDRGSTRRVAVRGNADGVTILVPVRRAGAAAISMLAHAPGGEDGFALLTLTPPAARPAAVPRNVTLVLDVSGSMSGRKMEQARAAARQLLATLRPEDRFRLIDFATDVRSFRDDFVPATRANLADAERYVRDLEASGSTNIAGALDEALRGPAGDDRLDLVLFVTDGAPTVGERRPEAIAARVARLRGDRRLFTFGVGADVNAALLERLALDGRGTAHFVRPNESVEHAVGVVASRLVDPVATELRVRVEGDARLLKLHPDQPMDLFAGQDLVLFARYRGEGRARVVVEGRSRVGPVRWSSVVDFPARERRNAFVARLWATQRVGWLEAEKRRGGDGAGSSEVDAEIRELGERFGIPTEFTSYFVREPGAQTVAADPRRPMPERQSGRALGANAAVDAGAGALPAPPPAAAQFESARRAADQRSALRLSEVVVTSAAAADSRTVGARQFTLVDGRWTDARWADTMRVVRVAPYSPAYFELLKLLPDLAEPFALGERVLVAGRRVAVEVAPSGATSLARDEIALLQSSF